MSRAYWKAKLKDRFRQLDPNGIILTEFDEVSGRIDFSNSVHQHQKQKFEDEAYVRVYLLLKLIRELKYRPQELELEKKYSIGHPSQKEARLDVLVRKKNKEKSPFMLIEAKTPENFQKEKDMSIKGQLFAIAKQEIKGESKPRYLVYYTIDIENDEVKDRALIIDFEKYPTYEDWTDKGEPVLDKIPEEYGIARKYTYANIDKPDETAGLKPLRKDKTISDLERLRHDLHNKLWAGGEADYNDIFYHLVKIMLVKIYDEMFTPVGKVYTFQVLYKNDEPETPEELAERLDERYKIALRVLLNYDEETIKKVPLIEKDKFTYEKLFYAVEKIQEISLTENVHSKDEDVLGLFFESILQNEFKQSKGQYFTHKNIVRFLIYALEIDNLAIQKLNQPQPHFPFIVDPAAGSGTFLIETMKMITKEVLRNENKLLLTRPLQDKIEDLENPTRRNKWAEEYVYGVEPNARLGLATKLNMILHGDGNMNVFIEDGLMPFSVKSNPFYTRKWKGKDQGLLAESHDSTVYPKKINGQFDILLSNPPFSMDIQAMRSYRYIKDTFLYWGNNSENLFVERWFQLLKPKGRLGVVLPESIFDTKENLYIRNFLYKYFTIKAVISLPSETFEPYTTTKVSLLIAEKRNDEEIKRWDEKWREFSNEYTKLRNTRTIRFFIENDQLLSSLRKLMAKAGLEIDYSKTLVVSYFEEISSDLSNTITVTKDKDRYDVLAKRIHDFGERFAIEKINTEETREVLKRFLKDFYPKDPQPSSLTELLEYVYDDILEVANLDFPNVPDQNNYCNSWWVFGEVSKFFNYPVFLAQAENIGYKRGKRGEKDKDLSIRNENGDIIAFKNDLFKTAAQKVKRQYWIKKGNKELLEEREEIVKRDIIIDAEKPDTILDHLRKAKMWLGTAA
jgi:type I restriction enzyme M protein